MKNVFDKYMNKAIKDGKLSNSELNKAMNLINASVTTSSFTMDAYTGINVTVTNTTTTIGKSDINVNTTVTNNKATNQITTEATIDTTNHYAAYVLYNPEWEGEKIDAVMDLALSYGISVEDIGTASVTSPKEFEGYWNSIGKTEDGSNVSAVVVDTHATNFTLELNNTSMHTSAISNLENKYIDDLILLACNAGHLDARNNNVAATFSQKINGD